MSRPRTPGRSRKPRRPIVILAAAAAVTAWAVAPAAAHETGPARHGGTGLNAQFVQRDGSHLVLGGRSFRFSGTNNYYLEYADPVQTDAVFDAAAASGSTVIRAWAFFDVASQADAGDKGVYFHYWDSETGAPAFNDGANGLEKLDHVIAQAKASGIRLILPLTNNWSDFGGMDQYNSWAGSTYHSDFYTDPTIRQWYRDWVAHVLDRVNTETGIAYKDDPTIMGWELANEPRCVGSGVFPKDPDCTVATLTGWVDEMSTYIKAIDPKHLVGTGDEGFVADKPGSDDWTRNGGEGVDSAAFAALPGIDYVSYHLYPDHWGKSYAWGEEWIALHSTIGRDVGKPVILGEYGALDVTERNPVYQRWTDAVRRTGGAGALFWILSDIQPDGSLYPDYDGFTVYANSPVSITLRNFATSLTTHRTVFPPVADDDRLTTDFATPVSASLVANDIAYRGRVAPWTVDLNPSVRGAQRALTTDDGTWAVDATGQVTFSPADGFAGRSGITYQVRDTRNRLSNTATVVATVKPSPTAAQTLFDFTGGAEGWSVVAGADPVANAAVADGVGGLLITTAGGGWFGAQLEPVLDAASRTQLSFDLVATTGVGPILALQVGPGWSWCQAQPVPWTSVPAIGDNAVTFDLTTLSADCAAQLGEVHAMYIYFNAGEHTIDDVTVS